jgi:hypothetical protein
MCDIYLCSLFDKKSYCIHNIRAIDLMKNGKKYTFVVSFIKRYKRFVLLGFYVLKLLYMIGSQVLGMSKILAYFINSFACYNRNESRSKHQWLTSKLSLKIMQRYDLNIVETWKKCTFDRKKAVICIFMLSFHLENSK